jgi:RNA polymerase sigma factor (sigma-70 family)
MAKKSLNGCLRHVCKLAAVQTARELGDRELLGRFVAEKDEAAFAVLVERHGPMVLGVCRRMLGGAHDAEDACQASFLVLAQKAASIRKSTSLPSWLHGVAARVASHVKRERLRRSRHEREAQESPAADPAAEVSWREVQTILDEELGQLPERLRAPLILCYLDGRPRDAAAQQLGLSVACLHGRLERGRKALCERLVRRGVTLSAALLAAAIGEGVARAALPPTTVLSTIKAAALISSGRALAEGLVSAKILTLAQEVSRNMVLTKLKQSVSALLAAGLLTAALAGSLALALARAGQQAKASPAAATPQPTAASGAQQAGDVKPAENDGKPATVTGRVLGLDDKPVAGAKVYLLHWGPPYGPAPGKEPPKPWAETDKDGRFSFTVAQRDLGELFVTAAGYGPGWVIKPGKLQETWPIEDNQLVRLPPDDVPVNGRLLDLQGQPLADVTVRVFALEAAPDGSLDKWIAAVKSRTLGQMVPEHEYLSGYRVDGLASFFPTVTTDKDGRFQIKGVGRERMVDFTVEAPTIETKAIHVLTRPGLGAGDVRVPEGGIMLGGGGVKELKLKPYYPPTFTHVADPCRVLTGVVRDKASGKPIAGAVVRGDQPVRYPLYYNRTTTDKEGRFRLTGLPLNPGFGGNSSTSLVALPPDGEPYLALIKRLPTDKEPKAASFDFDLPRGVWLEGKVKDKDTGRGVPAQLRYVVFQDPAPAEGVQGLPGVSGPYYRDPYGDNTDQDGKFRIIVAADRGLVGASALGEERNRYRMGAGADKIEGATPDGRGGIVFPRTPSPLGFAAHFFNTVVEVKPEKGATSLHCDVVLDPGRTLTVQVRGPDGKPLDGARAHGQSAGDDYSYASWSRNPLPAEFTVYGLEPGKGRTLLLEHAEKNLAARHEIKGDESGPVVVTLQPSATVVGRLVGDDGRPRPHADISVSFYLVKDAPRPHPHPIRTDAEGKFRIDGLIPGMAYRADAGPLGVYGQLIFDDLSLTSGERKDLGDVKAKKGDSQ